MRRLLLGIVAAGIVLVGIGYVQTNYDGTFVVENPKEQVEVIEEVIEDEDVIENARIELERINQELDAKETELLAEIAELELQVEKIRETRAGF